MFELGTANMTRGGTSWRKRAPHTSPFGRPVPDLRSLWAAPTGCRRREDEDMGALDDLSKKAQDFVADNKDKIDEALKSEQAENVSDKILGGLAEGVKKITPDEHDAKIDDVRKNLDGKIGNQ
jgi:hypothetical protein